MITFSTIQLHPKQPAMVMLLFLAPTPRTSPRHIDEKSFRGSHERKINHNYNKTAAPGIAHDTFVQMVFGSITSPPRATYNEESGVRFERGNK